VYVVPAAPAAEPVPAPAPKKDDAKPAQALLQVTLPADATLTIDDAKTTSTTASRTFVTPALESGKVYYYTLKAEVVRDGKTMSAVQRVTVRSGETSTVSIEIPAATGVAQK